VNTSGAESDAPWGAAPPAPLGTAPAFQAVGEVAAPLLAGFSTTLIGVIAQAPSSIRWPGAALVSLMMAVGALLYAVQAAFFARQHYWTRDELLRWYVHPPSDAFDAEFRRMNREHKSVWELWIRRTRRSYNAGIALLGVGLGLLLAPPGVYGSAPISTPELMLRWIAASIAWLLSIAELVWWCRSARRSKISE
jgi:hypothetical protein